MNSNGIIKDPTTSKQAAVVTGANTGVNGLRVYNSPTDPISDISVGIDLEHHQIHEGETHQWFFFGAVNATSKDIRISVPALAATTRTPHMIFDVVSDNTTAQVLLYEGTTWTAVGTDDSGNIRNRNRNLTTTVPGTKIYVTGGTALTVNALGNLLDTDYLFTSKAGANAPRSQSEWLLKASTEYLLRVTTTGSGSCLIKLKWYEDLGV